MGAMVEGTFTSTTDQPRASALKKLHRYVINRWNNSLYFFKCNSAAFLFCEVGRLSG